MMSEKAQTEMKIDNLVYKLNHIAEQRKALLDKMWVIEEETEKMRLELIKLINEREKC